MAPLQGIKTTFEPAKSIQPIYTGGGAAVDQSGRILASCLGEDVLVTDFNNGEQLARIEGDGEIITALSLTPSASHLILCSRSLSMRIYSLKPPPLSASIIVPELLRSLKPHSSPVITSAIDRTGTLLATGSAEGLVKVWDIKGGFVTHTLRGHSGIISALHFFEVAVAERRIDGGISAKNRKKGRRKGGVQGGDAMEDVDVDPPGEDSTRGFRLGSGGEDGQIRVWDLHKRTCIAVLDSHVSIVRSLAFSSNENALISGSRDKTIILWDVRSWKVRKVIPVLEGVEHAGFALGGSLVFTGGESGVLRLWQTDSGGEITQEQQSLGEGESIVDILYHDSLQYLISVHADQSLILHSLEPLSEFSGSGTLPPLPQLRRISGTHDEVIDLAYLAPSRSLLALATNSECIRIISLKSTDESAASSPEISAYFGADVALLKGHEDIIICLDVDWSGHWLATGAKDNTARLWRIDPENSSYICFATLTGHAESLGAISLPHTTPPPGSTAHTKPLDCPPQFVLTGSQDRTVKRWEVANAIKAKKAPRATYTRKAHDKDINAIDVNHNSTLFASASQDRTVKIWSVEEGEVQGVLRGHRRGVWSVRFAPRDTPTISGDGGPATAGRGLVLTGSGDKTVKIWSLSDYSCLRTLEGHTNSVLKVVWMNLSGGDVKEKRVVQVASAGGDGLVKVWDVGTGEVQCTLDNHEDRVWALTVHPETNTLISGGGDSVITFWEDTTAQTLEAATQAAIGLVEQEQQLQNYIYAGSYRQAITLALQLNHPGRLLTLLSAVTATTPPEAGSLCGVKAVDEVLSNLAAEQLYTLLLRIRDWNTNARTAPVAQRLLWALVKSYPASVFTGLRPAGGSKGGGGRGVKDVVDALKSYTEKHYRRMEELMDESYIVEYTLREMDDVSFANGGSESTSLVVGEDRDVVMT
ncbi:MAG: U3 small nucleolar RNA-associated protein 13 [Geoglossum umbratile]|nr:MAG: U3 small nucleolar RNA-associated protein 13 [Geoglossum umbratile]